MKIIEVNENNVSETGFFCFMSKRQAEGYQRKLRWLKSRLSEGMKIKIIKEGGRGFIEYIPGEYAWRAAKAEGYMFIHNCQEVRDLAPSAYGVFNVICDGNLLTYHYI